MKGIKRQPWVVMCAIALFGCGKQSPESNVAVTPIDVEQKQVFSVDQAKANLDFAKNQYLKMIDHIENQRFLEYRPGCENQDEKICVPRSQEHDGIFLELPKKWTNGFFPGVLWQLLSAKEYIDSLTPSQIKKLEATAKYYQNTLFSEAKRGSTHDLGFILYDSFGEALNYDGLDENTRKAYQQALDLGRATLATRYSDEVGLIRSWDWVPQMKIPTLEDGEQVLNRYSLANPWTYPVIVDNMMNLEYLLSTDVARYHEIAFQHAKNTSINHYFYDESDTAKQYPLSYHVFDYGSYKPGNWQGVGNVSAWARGQAWSLYGFVTIVEALPNAKVNLTDYPNFEAHLDRLVGSIEYLLKDDVVPYWDFFAARDNAYEYAENISPDTTVFHGVLGLCDKRIESTIKPYVGYRPMALDSSMLSDESLQALQGKVNWHGEKIIQGDKLLPCGTKPYPNTHVKIPKDTSAAAIYAAALYRYAKITNKPKQRVRLSKLADKIMAKLTSEYRTDHAKTGRESSLDLGFVLSEATGDMGNGGEIDTPIIYGDFYFVEANIRKIKFAMSQR